jgi:hypothetical protein
VPKKKNQGRKYKSTKAAEIRQEIMKPHTQVLVDSIFPARLPKFRTHVVGVQFLQRNRPHKCNKSQPVSQEAPRRLSTEVRRVRHNIDITN